MKCLMVRIWVTSVVYGYSNQQLYCMTYIGLRLLNQDDYYCPEWGLVPFYDDTRTNTISEDIRKISLRSPISFQSKNPTLTFNQP